MAFLSGTLSFREIPREESCFYDCAYKISRLNRPILLRDVVVNAVGVGETVETAFEKFAKDLGIRDKYRGLNYVNGACLSAELFPF